MSLFYKPHNLRYHPVMEYKMGVYYVELGACSNHQHYVWATVTVLYRTLPYGACIFSILAHTSCGWALKTPRDFWMCECEYDVVRTWICAQRIKKERETVTDPVRIWTSLSKSRLCYEFDLWTGSWSKVWDHKQRVTHTQTLNCNTTHCKLITWYVICIFTL